MYRYMYKMLLRTFHYFIDVPTKDTNIPCTFCTTSQELTCNIVWFTEIDSGNKSYQLVTGETFLTEVIDFSSNSLLRDSLDTQAFVGKEPLFNRTHWHNGAYGNKTRVDSRGYVRSKQEESLGK